MTRTGVGQELVRTAQVERGHRAIEAAVAGVGGGRIVRVHMSMRHHTAGFHRHSITRDELLADNAR